MTHVRVWFSSGIRECPIIFPWYTCNNDYLEIYEKLIIHVPMWTLKHQVCGHVTLRLRIHFFHLNWPSGSKRFSFINLCIHPSPFRHLGKLLQHSPLRSIHTFFFKNLLVFWPVKIFQRKTGSFSFQKRVGPLFFNYCFSL